MTNISPPKAPVLIPFICPICAGPNAIELIVLSRAGGMDCAGCGKHLRSADVMRAMHSPRPQADGETPVRVRLAAPKRPAMVWPPTPESRGAIAPLKKRHDGAMN